MHGMMTMAALTAIMMVSVAAHGMHSMHIEAGSSASTTSYKCPVCRMDTMGTGSMAYNNQNYVQLSHGQRIYTCGMDPRTIDGIQSTDTAYLAANMVQLYLLSGHLSFHLFLLYRQRLLYPKRMMIVTHHVLNAHKEMFLIRLMGLQLHRPISSTFV